MSVTQAVEITAAAVQEALDAGQIGPHLQPLIDLATGAVVGFEALARWSHPTRGQLGPAAFVPLAERAGLSPALTATMLEQALAALRAHSATRPGLHVAVNVAGPDLADPRLADLVLSTLERQQMPTSALRLEVTETSAMSDPEQAVRTLSALDDAGVSVWVDDYGTGLASLSYLHRLPVRALKLDRGFTCQILDDSAVEVIVDSTVSLARKLGLFVIAEGVEDTRTLAAVRDHGCAAAQGYAIARPAAPEQAFAAITQIENRTARALSGHPSCREVA